MQAPTINEVEDKYDRKMREKTWENPVTPGAILEEKNAPPPEERTGARDKNRKEKFSRRQPQTENAPQGTQRNERCKPEATEAFLAALAAHQLDVDGLAAERTLTEEDIPLLFEKWYNHCKDIIGGVPPTMPLLRKINHRIPLMDNNKKHCYHMPQCPDSMKPQLMEKIQTYTDNGWWEMKSIPQAAPMLCIPKKTGKLRTVVDLRQQNENMVKDVTPFPNQEQIREDVA
ncbi:hypothetical protein PAXINDRAFT_17433 [Paxillus involutus ATCC 200175]|uniref:Uncharacterized protein n=1 Tax=Paxillus involutus ATCC 200175 TaxID=664439 RepID=A0A0C9TNT1_PAXIN|nr:hypothetical protein PAXINDRAFT_17433 [Paxillus involutus ATCC 200175]